MRVRKQLRLVARSIEATAAALELVVSQKVGIRVFSFQAGQARVSGLVLVGRASVPVGFAFLGGLATDAEVRAGVGTGVRPFFLSPATDAEFGVRMEA